MPQSVLTPDAVEAALLCERPRLVAFCARMTGEYAAAEDLAQETLIEAWRSQQTLRDQERLAAWLMGIARNVCLRWARAQGRERGRRSEQTLAAAGSTSDHNDRFADTVDLEIELERKELVELLDRALALLPAETRAVLVERYVRESSVSEIAARLGVNAAAAAMRLQRGKLALRQILTTTLRQDIAPYLMNPHAGAWQETRIWCFVCGQRRLQGRLTDDSTLILTCPQCFPAEQDALFSTCPEIWGNVKGYGRAFARTLDWMERYYQAAQAAQTPFCYVCGSALPVARPTVLSEPVWASRQVRGFHQRCRSCGAESSQPLAGLALASPEGRRFQREHPRMRLLPEQDIEVDGRAAVVTRFVSMTGAASLDVISALDSGQALRVATSL